MAFDTWLGCVPVASINGSGFYFSLGYNPMNPSSTEADHQARSAAGTYDMLSFYITSTSGTVTMKFRVNGSDGNQVVAGSSTGWFQDTTHSDVLSNNDLFCGNYAATANSVLNGNVTVHFNGDTAFNIWTAKPDGGVILGTGNNAQVVYPGGGLGFLGEDSSAWTTAAKFTAPGVMSRMRGRQDFNPSSGDATFRVRVNTTNSAVVITSPTGTTGSFEDTTHSATISTGDFVTYTYNVPDTFSRWYIVECGFEGDDAEFNIGSLKANISSQTDTDPHFVAPFGDDFLNATEANVQALVPCDFTTSHLAMVLSVHTAGADLVGRLRINGGNSTQLVTSVTTTTGWFTDTTHTDDITAGDLINYSYTGAGNAYIVRGFMLELAGAGGGPEPGGTKRRLVIFM